MKHLLILLAMAMAPVAMNAQDNSKQVQPEKATTKACCSKDKKEGAACHKDGKNDEKVCDKDSKEGLLQRRQRRQGLLQRRQKRWYGF